MTAATAVLSGVYLNAAFLRSALLLFHRDRGFGLGFFFVVPSPDMMLRLTLDHTCHGESMTVLGPVQPRQTNG